MTIRKSSLHKYRKMIELSGKKITLRRTVNTHTEELYQEIKTPGVLENLTIDVDDIHDFRRYILFVENQWHMNQDYTYSIFNGENQIVGQISIYNIAYLHKRGEIGIWIGRDFWRKGYAYDALKTILTYGFSNLHLNRIQAHMFIENEASISLFEHVGFIREGLIREFVQKNDKFMDVYSYSLLNREYSNN